MIAPDSRRRWKACVWASSPAPSGRTAVETPRSSGWPASGWASRRRPSRHRWCRATGTRTSSPRSRSPLPRSTASPPRSATWREPSCARCRSRFAAARRAPRRCRTSAIPWWRSACPGSRAWCAPRQRWAWRTSRSGTSATSPTRARSEWCSPMRSWRSTTCSTASPGSSTGSSSTPSGCGGTSTRRTAWSSASASFSPLSPRGFPGTRPTVSSSETPSPPGTRSATSGSSSRRIRRSPPAWNRRRSPRRSTSEDALRHVDVLFERLGGLAERARERKEEAVHA